MKIDWEQRRYEIAKEVMAAFIAGPSYQLCVNNNYYEASLARPWAVAEDASELDGCLVSEDGIRRILQAREAIVISCPPVARETVLDIFEAELPCGGRHIRLCQDCSVSFRRIKRMI